ncbi:MAG: hypothetical protein JXD18_03665 [Anaerolineae bacterium]|nr:hypothetical protein [Anaerolineae bacterium]
MNEHRDRHRLAWFILLSSFFLCVALAIGTPLGVRQFIRTARVRQEVVLEPQRGTPSMQRGGAGPVEAVIEPIPNILPNTFIATDENAHSTLTIYVPSNEQVAAATVQIYNSTDLVFVSARSPRFDVSPLPHAAVIQVTSGRVRVTVAEVHGRPTVVTLHTPHASAALSEGSYEVRVNAAFTEFAVREGVAEVSNDNDAQISLGPSERTIARPGATSLASFEGERNLLSNGNFDQALERYWDVYERDVQNQPGGTVGITSFGGRSAARFQRLQEGMGHAEVGIQQTVNYDVRDFSSLTLHLNIQILYQSLRGCGTLGSECPIMIRIAYKDVDGTDREWYHGFYALDAAESDLLAAWDEQVPGSTWYTFDSGNLMELFERPPASIKEIAIYASGHAFDALVTEVELLAQE